MQITVSLFGFGDDRPAKFKNSNRLLLSFDTASTPSAVLKEAGFSDFEYLVVMINDLVVSQAEWESKMLNDGDVVKVLSAIEGG